MVGSRVGLGVVFGGVPLLRQASGAATCRFDGDWQQPGHGCKECLALDDSGRLEVGQSATFAVQFAVRANLGTVTDFV